MGGGPVVWWWCGGGEVGARWAGARLPPNRLPQQPLRRLCGRAEHAAQNEAAVDGGHHHAQVLVARARAVRRPESHLRPPRLGGGRARQAGGRHHAPLVGRVDIAQVDRPVAHVRRRVAELVAPVLVIVARRACAVVEVALVVRVALAVGDGVEGVQPLLPRCLRREGQQEGARAPEVGRRTHEERDQQRRQQRAPRVGPEQPKGERQRVFVGKAAGTRPVVAVGAFLGLSGALRV